ncbi:class I SAM-dependent methyltransferase [Rhodoblastus acidophilus]|uniref:Class I SAM-dependent methyltransferase n=1 Tax=Candidatus Rhodoblastus alkanivorans TaxID=2954117 RepID=A0ABS9Z4F6_9HYPH|nr:class I SAM-dependent methyltransferase [Candidatus Rhodoblastus alkanivorans]MCI4680218.1 class I SAM-dependent methyltransferase [Candidatus Rhodoblastus alkanivorans]MCI4682260.1 class I SAM-dependent methyltransferase [Candidatus Rhodoblastus alkanivorans]MDI4639562.1 class I SAM-dependent methyltransferase [Rhodoblastus acidophilus]
MTETRREIAQLENAHVEEAYARWAPVYDLAFAAVMAPGRRAAVAAAQCRGGLILDVGVGTGLELPMFDAKVSVVGVDLSEPMLRRAQTRAAREKLLQVAGLCVMDATRLAFPSGAFDSVVAPYVLTVVPDPAATLDELARVVKPGGEIVLVNHVGAESGPLAWIESWLGQKSASLGWRPEFPWAILGDWIASRPDLRLVERRKIPPLGLFTLARIERIK